MKRRARGIVTSDRMDKTIKVSVKRVRQHPRYKKYLRKQSVLTVHDPHDTAQEGDLVEVEETRPLSKTKSWRFLRVVKRSAEYQPISGELSAE